MNSDRDLRRKWIIASGAAIGALLQLGVVYGQNPGSQPAYLSQPPFQPANSWMKQPIAWSPEIDRVAGTTRQARDQYFDQLIGYREPLTPSNAKGSGISVGVPLPNQGEIPDVPSRAVVIGTFASYQPVLSNSGRAIYTEATFLVNYMFEDSSGTARPGGTFTLIIPGGTVRTDSGAVLSFLTQPRAYSVTVGRMYLLTMSYNAGGTFFILAKDWDVTDGIVRANFSASPSAPASLIGLSLQQLVAKLKAQFGKS